MTQDYKDSRVEDLISDPYDNASLVRGVCDDLLSLRAAVRRVLEAFECAFSSDGAGPLERMQFGNQMLELRAEMAGIDGGSNKDKA